MIFRQSRCEGCKLKGEVCLSCPQNLDINSIVEEVLKEQSVPVTNSGEIKYLTKLIKLYLFSPIIEEIYINPNDIISIEVGKSILTIRAGEKSLKYHIWPASMKHLVEVLKDNNMID